MEIRTIWVENAKFPQFNLELASAPGADAFLVIKGCKIAEGSKGQFVSGPSTKNGDGKYWNHTYFGPKFSEAVLEKALASQAKPKKSSGGGGSRQDDDIPF